MSKIKSISKSRQVRLKEYAKVKAAYLKARSIQVFDKYLFECDCCGGTLPIKKATIHHKRGRIAALLTDTRHWAALCIGCHHRVTDHPEWARKAGLLCEPGLWNTVDRTPKETP